MRSLLTGLAAALAGLLALPVAAQPYAYVPNYQSGNVSVINTATDSVVTTIGGVPCGHGVAVHPASQRAYITNPCNNRLEVINTSSNTVLASLAVNGLNPYAVAVNAAGTRAFVVNYFDGGANANGEVVIIDLGTGSVLAEVPVGHAPYGGVVHPDGSTVYVSSQCVSNGSCGSPGIVSAIATTAPYARTDRTAGLYPLGVAISPDGSRVYVASYYNPSNGSTGLLSVLDTATLAISHAPTSGQGAYGVAVHPSNGRVYVSHSTSSNVSVFDGGTLAVLATVNVGSAPQGIDVHPDGSRIYVANASTNNVSVINAASNTVASTVTVGTSPYAFGRFIQAATATISGTITTSLGVAMSSLTVANSGTPSTTTNGSGFYSFANLANGSYTITPPSLANYTFAPASRIVNLAGVNATGQNFVGTYNAIPDITTLRAMVVAANLTDTRLRSSLLAPLDAALVWLNGTNPDRVQYSCSNLAKFIAVVRQNITYGKLPAATGNPWIVAANDILALSGCPTR